VQFVSTPSHDASNRVLRAFLRKILGGGGEYQFKEKTADAVCRTAQFMLCDAGIPVVGKTATYEVCSLFDG
jgi:hypothetical protein